jgi:dTDP-L-rhamnose 4-epimerase
MSRVLITGGAGFIGSRLALALRERAHQVTVLDRLSAQVHTSRPEQSPLYRSIAERVRFIRGDVTERQTLEGALRDQDIVVHLAAETGTGQSMYEIARYCGVNIGGTALLLDLLANGRHAVQRLVIASSRAIYGEGKYLCPEHGVVYPTQRSAADLSRGDFAVRHAGCGAPLEPLPTDEEALIHPTSVYGITKHAQEQLVMTVCPGLGIAPVALRYQNVYGPGQSVANPYTGILSIFANLAVTGRPINVFEDGEESRDFVYVDDAVEASVLAIESARAAGGIFNVGSGRPVTVLGVARALTRQLGAAVPIEVSGNFRIGDIRHNYACLERIGATLGYRPRCDFESGVALLCAWVRSVDSAGSGYEASLAEMRGKGLLK